MTDADTPEELEDIPEELEDIAMLAMNKYGGAEAMEMGFTGNFAALAGMNESEKEEYLLLYGPRKLRKAIKARRKEREQAKKQG